MSDDGYLRIGELGRRVGVAPELLRAWERRYGLLEPSRSTGGFRLYSTEDERRVRAMRANLERGYSAAEAARLATAAGPPEPAGSGLEDGLAELRRALDAFDEAAANAALDRLLSAFSVDAVLRDVVLPYLHELGERWERGAASVAQEHFASNVLRGRLLGLARGWGQGGGPRALLACAPGEQHDLALVVFGIALRARGWRITYLGPDTPLETVADAAAQLKPDLVVVTATDRKALAAAEDGIGALAEKVRVGLAGPGASAELAASTGAELLGGDPVAEAERVTATA